jgi:acetolactate synthase small subunit
MSYKKYFTEDEVYQNAMKDFKRKVAKFKGMAERKVYTKESLMAMADKLANDLKAFVMDYHNSTLEQIKKELEDLENQSKMAGYADRPADTKEFEMRYALAEEHELIEMVQELKSEDLLEINLLRMELRKRNMNDIDRKVRMYVINKELEGLEGEDKVKYDQLKDKLSVFSSMGKQAVILDGEYMHIDTIHNDLREIVRKADQSDKAKGFNLADLMNDF